LEQSETLESFFWQKLVEALKEQRVETEPQTEHYLVRLLAEYATRPVDDTPLAIKLLAAREAASPERQRQLREVGDTSLFVSGFWSESFTRRIVDVDYYIGLGGSAYSELARTGDGWARAPLAAVFAELGEKFARFVAVLGALSRYLMPATAPQDVLKLYDQYRSTGSRWAASRLAALGVLVPNTSGGRPQ
jgi:hypothetical protein